MRNKRILVTCVATLLCAASLPVRGADSPREDKVARPASAAVVVAKQQAVSAGLPGKQGGDQMPATVSLSSVQLNASLNAQSGISGAFVDSGGQRWASTGTCQDCDAGFCDGQAGLQGGFAQDCNEDNCWDTDGSEDCTLPDEDLNEDGLCDLTDCLWIGLAFPVETGGGIVDTLDFQLNTNRVGGDVYIVGESSAGLCNPSCPQDTDKNGEVRVADLIKLLACWGEITGESDPQCVCVDVAGGKDGGPDDQVRVPDLIALLAKWGTCGDAVTPCRPDVNNILARMCCALEGLATGVPLELHFPAIDTSGMDRVWVLFVGRTGQAGQDAEGNFNGTNFASHQLARECAPDTGGTCTVPSQPGIAFGNLAGPGSPGLWADLHLVGSGVGTCFCVELALTSQSPDEFDCSLVPTGACCELEGDTCLEQRRYECDIDGGTFLGNDTVCADCAGG